LRRKQSVAAERKSGDGIVIAAAALSFVIASAATQFVARQVVGWIASLRSQ
jgi:hypothetical protein